MSAIATLAATGASLAALGWLAATDPKRRRAFRLSLAPVQPRARNAAWALALLPGALVPLASGGAGFVLWLGAVSVAGWGLAAMPPDDSLTRLRSAALEALRERLARLAARLGGHTRALRARLPAPAAKPEGDAAARIARLEARVSELEAELMARRATSRSAATVEHATRVAC